MTIIPKVDELKTMAQNARYNGPLETVDLAQVVIELCDYCGAVEKRLMALDERVGILWDHARDPERIQPL